MAVPIIPFEEVELSRLFSESARGGEVFQTSIIGNRYSIHQRNVASINPPRKWSIDFHNRTAIELEVLRTFFNSKFGMGIGFRFRPPSDYQFNGDVIGTGTGSQTVFPLYRKYIGGSQTMSRRILKPSNVALTVAYNGTPQSFTLGSNYTIQTAAGTITFASAPSNGTSISLTGGEYCVPVVFDMDTFESEDISTISNWQGVGLVELLAANLGLT